MIHRRLCEGNAETSERAGVSNCLVCQGALACEAIGTSRGCQRFRSRTMAFMMVNSVCMQAVRATFLALPAANRRSYKALITGWWRVAPSAPIDNTARTSARPPYTVRRPRRVPLSRLQGATPLKAASGWVPRGPHAGTWPSIVRASTGPTPGMRLTGVRQGVIEPGDRRGQPGDRGLDGVLDTRRRGVQSGALGAHPRDELAPPPAQGPQLLGLGIRQGPGRRRDGLRTVRHNTRSNAVGCGQDPHRLPTGPDVAGSDHDHGEGRGHQRGHQRSLGAPSRLEDDQGGGPGAQAHDERVNARGSLGRPPSLRGRSDGDVAGRCGDINTPKERGRYQGNLLDARPTLQDTGSMGPGNCSGCSRGRRADPRSPTVSHDQRGNGLARLYQLLGAATLCQPNP